ncbi:unnamed protein product [Heterosigma akashiwo]
MVQKTVSHEPPFVPQNSGPFPAQVDHQRNGLQPGRVHCTQDDCSNESSCLYNMAPDSFDENLKLSKNSVNNALLKFLDSLEESFGEQYIRRPTPADLERIFAESKKNGFPGYLGSLDRMRWRWHN